MANLADQKVDYIEMPGRDLPGTRAFFEAVFGWTFEDYGPAYTAWNDGRLTGGFYQAEDVPGGGALIVLYAADLEATLEAVRAQGAKISKEIFSFPGGRRFQFIEPSGNELSVWSEDPGAQA